MRETEVPDHRQSTLPLADDPDDELAQHDLCFQLAADELHVGLQTRIEHFAQLGGLETMGVLGGEAEGEGIDTAVFFAREMRGGGGREALEGLAEEEGLGG